MWESVAWEQASYWIEIWVALQVFSAFFTARKLNFQFRPNRYFSFSVFNWSFHLIKKTGLHLIRLQQKKEEEWTRLFIRLFVRDHLILSY